MTGEREYSLGQRVSINGTVEKVRDRVNWRPRNTQRIYTEAIDAWDYLEEQTSLLEYGMLRTRLVEAPAKVAEGIIVGKRTIQQGVTDSASFDEPACFFPCRIVQVWLVAYHLRRKPVMCIDGQLKELGEDSE